jgi:hypothetical protein
MSWSDFTTHFENLYVCRVFKTALEGGTWHRYIAHGEWKGRSAGGCPNSPDTAQFNPQFMLAPTAPCTVFVALKQLETPGSARSEECIGLKIVRKGGHRVKCVYAGEQVASAAYAGLAEVSCEASLTPESPFYTLFVSTFEPGKEGRFLVEVFADAPLTLVDGDKLRQIPESVSAT